MSTGDDEARRIRAEFERRDRELGRDFYSLSDPANLFIRHGQERALQSALRLAEMVPLRGKRVLEIGCGRGQWLSIFESFGASRGDIAGIDLDDARIHEAQARYPGADLRAGDASSLPWPSAAFDVVFLSTVFSSILDEDMRRSVAGEARRVLKPGGAIIVYDFRYDNPRNPNVRGLRPHHLRDLFSGCGIEIRSATLAPPVARKLVPLSWSIGAVLERLRVLNTHFVAVIRSC